MDGPQSGREVRAGQRRIEQKALAEIATELTQQARLLGGFDALGDHGYIECVGEIDDGRHDLALPFATADRSDEGLVDLDFVDRKPVQVAQ